MQAHKSQAAPAAANATKSSALVTQDQSCLIQAMETIFYVVRNKNIQSAIIVYENKPINYEPIKLHIYFPISHLSKIGAQVNQLLKKAIGDLIIIGFKVIDIEALNKSASKDNWRGNHMVYTLYLFEKFSLENAKRLENLCLEIEAIIRKAAIPRINFKSLYKSEVPLSDYFILRVTNTDTNMAAGIKVYYDVNSSRVILAALEATALNSDYYKYLIKALITKPQMNTTVALSQHVADGKSPISVGAAKKDAVIAEPVKVLKAIL